MGRAQLGLREAVDVLRSVEIKYSNMGALVKSLVQQGFTEDVARQAVQLEMRKRGPEVSMLQSFAGVDVEQAVKMLFFNSDMSLGEVWDALKHKGISDDEISAAIDRVDADEVDNAEVGGFRDIDEEGNPIRDHNVGSIDEMDDSAFDVVERALRHNPHLSQKEIADLLTKVGVPADAIRAFIRELFMEHHEPKTAAGAPIVHFDDIAQILHEHQIPDEKIENVLRDNGATDAEAAHAVNRLEKANDLSDEGSMDNPAIDPTDPSLAGEGSDPGDGSGGMISEDVGGVGPLGDDSGTGVGGMGTEESGYADGAPMGMDQLGDSNPVEPDPTDPAEEPVSEAQNVANKYIAADPNMTGDQLAQLLITQGYGIQEAKQVANEMNLSDGPEALRAGASVSYKGVNTKVAAISSSLYGEVAILADGRTAFVDDEDLVVVTEKVASVEVTMASLLEEVKAFNEGTYAYEESDLLRKATEAKTLLDKMASYKPQNVAEEVELRKEYGQLQTAAKVFAKAASDRSEETQEYLASQPQYKVAAQIVEGYEFGPGGGDAIHMAAAELEEERAAIDWNKFATVEGVNFVEQHPEYLSSDADMRKAANSHVSSHIAHLEGDKKEEVRNTFLAIVEKTRRMTVRELGREKKARVEETGPAHNFDEGVFI